MLAIKKLCSTFILMDVAAKFDIAGVSIFAINKIAKIKK
jgi:hypothetical protein